MPDIVICDLQRGNIYVALFVMARGLVPWKSIVLIMPVLHRCYIFEVRSQMTRSGMINTIYIFPGCEGMRPCALGAKPCAWSWGLAPMQFELVFCSPQPLSAKSLKSWVMTCSVEVSPLPANRTITPFTFTEWQKAFVGPHHQTKILGQKQPINH